MRFGQLAGGLDEPVIKPNKHNTNSEKSRLERMRFKEHLWNTLMAPTYIINHEKEQKFMLCKPGVWHHQALRDYCENDGMNGCTVKGRQVYETSKKCLMMLHIARYMPGAICMIDNMNHSSAEATLASRVVDVLKQTFPGIAKNTAICSISANRLLFKRKEGAGGDSAVYAGKTKGRGATPFMTLFTEFPQVCATDPERAREHLDGTVSGAQFASHFLEGTASHLASGSQMNTIMEKAVERQRSGIKLAQQDWRAYFYPWFCVPNRIVPDEEWDPNRQMPREALDYFKKLEDTSVEYMIGRDIHKGGIHLTDQQKRFWCMRFEGEKLSSMDAMLADYPSLLSESLRIGTRAHYLIPAIRAAREERRVGEYQLIHGSAVHIGTDIGWNDESVAIFAQMDLNGQWRVLGGFAVKHQSVEMLANRMAHYNFGERTGIKPVLWLPHDAGKKNHTALKMTGRMGVTVEDDFNRDGRLNVVPVIPQPGSKAEVFGNILEVFPHVRFHGEGCRELLGALSNCRKMEVRRDNVLLPELAKTSGRHWHDAFGVLAYCIKYHRRRFSRRSQAADYIQSQMPMGGWAVPRNSPFA